MNCTCKIPEPRIKCSENGATSYCNKCVKNYDNKPKSLIYTFSNEIKEDYTRTTARKTDFENFLDKNNLMQKGKIKTDPIVNKVIELFKQRSKVGIEKYGTTLEDNNTDDFLQHTQEELMDAILYIEKLKSLKL